MDETLFDPIIGHRRLKAKLARLIDEDRLPHAMIFAGPAGVGKTMMAVAVASAWRVVPSFATWLPQTTKPLSPMEMTPFIWRRWGRC